MLHGLILTLSLNRETTLLLVLGIGPSNPCNFSGDKLPAVYRGLRQVLSVGPLIGESKVTLQVGDGHSSQTNHVTEDSKASGISLT